LPDVEQLIEAVRRLEETICKYIDEHNESVKPFV